MNAFAPLTIGIDARAAAEVPAGRGRVVRELLRALAARPEDGRRYVLYARETWAQDELDERFRWRLIDAGDPWWHVRAARAANRECEVFLSSNSYLTAWFLRIPCVPIVYDLVTFEAWDAPQSPLAGDRAADPRTRRAPLGGACSRSPRRRPTRSCATSRRRKAARVVAPLGVASALTEDLNPAEASTLPAPGFVLAVGTLEPRKNLPRLVAAYKALDEELQRRHPLVVVGALGWETGETLDSLRSLGDRARMLGYVSDAALAELYRRCAVFCYPSLGEGFGLPVLEAMAAGAAVLTSNVSSLPEVGGEAVAYADPLRVQDIAAQLQSLLGDESRRAELAELAQARASEFSWARFAELTLAALERAPRGS